MKRELVVSDSGPIFSLAIVNQLHLLDELFEEIYVPKAVWDEITLHKTVSHYKRIFDFFQFKVKHISKDNVLSFIMDYGESEAVTLYKEIDADLLLIDDKKARMLAENLGIECIGTLGILSKARSEGLIQELRPIFEAFIKAKRYYSTKLLNTVLHYHDEEEIE